MSFLPNVLSAVVKTVLTPIAIVKDVVNIATSEEPNSTRKLLESVGKDVEKALDDL